MAKVSESEVLLLWRALSQFRTGKNPACAAQRKTLSPCPMHEVCPRWSGPGDYSAAMEETVEETERRRAAWPCSRLLELLSPQAHSIG
jgi:hypothetical protein